MKLAPRAFLQTAGTYKQKITILKFYRDHKQPNCTRVKQRQNEKSGVFAVVTQKCLIELNLGKK
jgi:hypothetical protein